MRNMKITLTLVCGSLAFAVAQCCFAQGPVQDKLKVLIYYGEERSNESDAKSVTDFFQKGLFPGAPPERTHGIQGRALDGQVTAKSIEKQVADLNVAPEITGIVVYFSCHGNMVKQSGEQVIWLSARESLRLEDLRNWAAMKNPRFVLIVCDMCSSYIPEAPKSYGGLSIEENVFDELFLKPVNQEVIVMAASPGQSAWGDKLGGCLTKGMLAALSGKKNDIQSWEMAKPKIIAFTKGEFDGLKGRYEDVDLSHMIRSVREQYDALRKTASQDAVLTIDQLRH